MAPKSTFIVTLLALTAAVNGPLPAQEQTTRPAFEALAQEQQLLVLDWLARDCGSDDRLALEDRITALGARLEPVFWEAYQLGPPADQLAIDREAIRDRFEVRRKWLSEDDASELFGPEEVERLTALDAEAYMARELESIRVGYATAAILGLALVATEEGSSEKLTSLAEDPEHPAAEAVRQALEALAGRRAGD